jgi:hypothetical protein
LGDIVYTEVQIRVTVGAEILYSLSWDEGVVSGINAESHLQK